ncbi:MAG: hypothetical protein R2821_12400 [Flavobacteriaceae bacterium]
MKTIFALTFFFIVNSSLTFSQISKKRVYEISVIEQPQKVELIEYENGQFEGNVITKITKGKYRSGWLNRSWRNLWNIERKNIIDKNSIEKNVVKKLMTELKESGIESIKDCSEDEECNDQRFLDSGIVLFKVKTIEFEIVGGFEEIYPLNKDNKEEIKLRIKAQNLITILYENIDLKQRYSDLFKRLPRGYYHYYQSSGHLIVTIKNRKRKK